MSLSSIMVVDADGATRKAVARELRELGHEVSETDSAGKALQALRRQRPDLMVLEWTLPDVAGLEVLSDIKRSEETKPVRVLMTSARGEPDDVVAAFEYGADDFIDKPFSMRELVARVGACLRRPASMHANGTIRAGGIVIDNVGHRVIVDGNYLSLAPREYRLLNFLLTNQDRVFSRRQLLMHVWDRDAHVGARTVDVHVRRLRSLLEPYGYDSYLQTVRGSGYRFSLES
ncbi:MAG: winged helix-turn-helix domain-containing protein [Gammaproteobacteria bacterium]|nr:winged helix-turn-helix domain-containing protein [Gammaproteobacteria bacterium]MDH4253493.1 winged helix-turn-helix domain-containing protein [Gammaproteobacteria bacterium]MDH5309726.1 winged helix-turn-helix domain-containing protein [Gammaproteobacteria bacterium]